MDIVPSEADANKPDVISMRLKSAEKKIIEHLAEADGLKVAPWCRKQILIAVAKKVSQLTPAAIEQQATEDHTRIDKKKESMLALAQLINIDKLILDELSTLNDE